VEDQSAPIPEETTSELGRSIYISLDARNQGQTCSLPLRGAYKQAWNEQLHTDLTCGFKVETLVMDDESREELEQYVCQRVEEKLIEIHARRTDQSRNQEVDRNFRMAGAN
jgi:hypothetical protein